MYVLGTSQSLIVEFSKYAQNLFVLLDPAPILHFLTVLYGNNSETLERGPVMLSRSLEVSAPPVNTSSYDAGEYPLANHGSRSAENHSPGSSRPTPVSRALSSIALPTAANWIAMPELFL